jgi:hypothetical protein
VLRTYRGPAALPQGLRGSVGAWLAREAFDFYARQGNPMTVSTPLSGVNQPFKGILLIVVATFLFSSHDALSKYLSGFYPIVMVVWARYLVHTC